MSTSGTLHKFFKQPSQSTDRQPIIIEDLLQESDATPSSSSKRKGAVSTGDVGKRRKLSLSTLRVKQNNIAALPPMVVISEAEQQTSKQVDGCTKSPSQSVKDVLSYSKSKIKEVLPKDDLDKVVTGCTKSPPQSVKDVLSYSNSKVKEVLPKDYPDKAGTSDSKSKAGKKKVVKLLPKNKEKKVFGKNHIDSILASKAKDCLKLSTSPVKFTDSPIRAKGKSRKHVVASSDSDEEMKNLTSAELEKSGRSKSPKCDASSSTSDDEEVDVDSSFGRRSKMMLESDSDEEIKISSAVEEHKRSKSPSLQVSQASTEDDHASTLDTSVTGRRSGRTRKPVERFTIDLSEDEDDTKRKSCKKKTPSKKKGKENTPPLEDDIFIIDDKPKPRRSISAVLGGKGAEKKKKKTAEPTRMSSSILMQEAKKLMSSSNRGSPIHMSSSSPTPASAVSVPKLLAEVVWPKISHCGLSKEIIMYPLLEDDPEYLEDFDLDLDNIKTGFRHEIPQPQTNKSQVCSKTYDECVEELATNHPSSDVENIVEQYTNCKRTPSHLLSEGPKELQQWEDRTWNQIYCPVDYKKIIGNKPEVKQLYKWLDGWRVRLLNEKIRKKKKQNSYSDSDSDSEYVDTDGEEVRWLDNVVLITGPSGVGKSGAIATCANQLGYKVKELNASSERTGKNVAELFSEASQSHCVTGKSGAADFTKLVADISAKNAAKRKKRKSAGGLENFYSKPKKTDKNSSEIINVDDKPSKVRKKKKSEEGKEKRKKSQEGKGKLKLVKQSESVAAVQEAGSKVDKLSLIVLEEIDIAFEEDRGFLAAIVALTQVAKRPIILTSNNPNIALPTDSEFLVLKFNPPKTESVMLNMGCLSLSCNNHIAPYQLQQYSQYFNSDLRRLLVNFEFLNISSPKGTLTEIDIARHFFGVKRSLAPQKLFLEQTQSLNLQFVYLNLGKLLKKKQPTEERQNLLEQVVCSDTFVYLDMLSPKTHSSELDLFPIRTSSSLSENISHLTDSRDDCFIHRVSVEDGLLNFLNIGSNSLLNTRVNAHKLKECKRFAQIKEVQRGIHEAVSHVNLVSRSVVDEFSALRGICKIDKIKEESGAKRRFKHYLDNDIGIKNRELLAEYWLGS